MTEKINFSDIQKRWDLQLGVNDFENHPELESNQNNNFLKDFNQISLNYW